MRIAFITSSGEMPSKEAFATTSRVRDVTELLFRPTPSRPLSCAILIACSSCNCTQDPLNAVVCASSSQAGRHRV
jgi:hypothetical protein